MGKSQNSPKRKFDISVVIIVLLVCVGVCILGALVFKTEKGFLSAFWFSVKLFFIGPAILVGVWEAVKWIVTSMFPTKFSNVDNTVRFLFPIVLVVLGIGIASYSIYEYCTYQQTGTYCYQLLVYNTDNDRTYYVPAEVNYYGADNSPEYELIRFYWSNGGNCSFSSGAEVVPNEVKYVTDDTDCEYKVKLLLSRTEHPQITEKLDPKPKESLFYGVGISAAIFVCLIYSRIKSQKVKSVDYNNEIK